jgi:hypothetical protein
MIFCQQKAAALLSKEQWKVLPAYRLSVHLAFAEFARWLLTLFVVRHFKNPVFIDEVFVFRTGFFFTLFNIWHIDDFLREFLLKDEMNYNRVMIEKLVPAVTIGKFVKPYASRS